MKKILVILTLLVTLCLTSCKEEQQMENPTDEIISLLKLNQVKEGKLLNSTHASENDYVEVMVASNPIETLFVYNVNFDESFKKNGSKINELQIKALTFVTTITEEQQSLIMDEVYNESYGIQTLLDIAYECKGFYYVTNVDKGLELYDSGEDNVTLSVLYLPVRVKVVEDGSVTVDNYVMVPIYSAFNIYENDTYTDSKFTGYTILGVDYLDSSNYLKNKVE